MSFRYLAAVGLALFLLAFLSSVASGPNLFDEVWFLQVVHRMGSGEVLFRDIRFNVPPLAPYLARFVTTPLGEELLVLKALLALAWAGTAVFCLVAARKLAVGASVRFWLPVVFLVHANRFDVALYSPLATLLLCACFVATLSWRQDVCANSPTAASSLVSRRGALLAGLAGGLCFAAKHSTGIAALGMAAGTAMVTWIGRSQRFREASRDLAVFALAFLAVLSLVMIPVWWSGALPEVVQIFDKAAYLEHGGVSYLDGLETFARSLPPKSAPEAFLMFKFSAFLLPPLALLALVLAFARASGDGKKETLTVALFGLAGLTMIFPRADWSHVTFAMPPTLVSLAYGLSRVGPGVRALWKHVFIALGSVWLLAGLLVVVGAPLLDAVRASHVAWEVRHFRGAVMPEREWTQWMSSAHALEAAVGPQDRLFILSPLAGFYYLITGLDNPSRYDYPLVSQFGSGGQEEIMAAIEQGSISHVCVAGRWPKRLRPDKLIEFVEANLEIAVSLHACKLYRSTSTRPEVSR